MSNRLPRDSAYSQTKSLKKSLLHAHPADLQITAKEPEPLRSTPSTPLPLKFELRLLKDTQLSPALDATITYRRKTAVIISVTSLDCVPTAKQCQNSAPSRWASLEFRTVERPSKTAPGGLEVLLADL